MLIFYCVDILKFELTTFDFIVGLSCTIRIQTNRCDVFKIIENVISSQGFMYPHLFGVMARSDLCYAVFTKTRIYIACLHSRNAVDDTSTSQIRARIYRML